MRRTCFFKSRVLKLLVRALYVLKFGPRELHWLWKNSLVLLMAMYSVIGCYPLGYVTLHVSKEGKSYL